MIKIEGKGKSTHLTVELQYRLGKDGPDQTAAGKIFNRTVTKKESQGPDLPLNSTLIPKSQKLIRS